MTPDQLPPVMILGAGLGTRLGEYGKRVPKILAEIRGRPLLAWHLDHLAAEGFGRAVVNVHHLSAAVERFATGYDGPVELLLVHEERPLGTAGGLVNAWPRLGGERAVVAYGDVVPGPSLRDLADAHARHGPLGTLAAYRATASQHKGTVVVGDDDRVVGFREKDPELRGDAWINAGLMVIERGLTEGIAGGQFADFGHDVFPSALARGADLRVYRLSAPVLDIGTPEALALAQAWRSP